MNRKWCIRNFSSENWTSINDIQAYETSKRFVCVWNRLKRRECLKFLFFDRSKLEANFSKLFPRIHLYIYAHLHQDGNAITMVAR